MRKITVKNRWRLAVYWLSAAFLISLAACTAGAYVRYHEQQQQQEHAALLFASDLLALRDSRASGDGKEEVYLALLQSRIPQLPGRPETERLAAALETDLLNTLAAETEDAVRRGTFSASWLRELLGKYLPDPQSSPFVRVEASPALRKFGESDAVSAARTLLGLRFQRSASGQDKTAYCRNAVSVFDSRGTALQAYTVYAPAGKTVLGDGFCLEKAVRFVGEQGGMRVRQISDAWDADGVRYILLECGGQTALVGVRRDSGSVCFFLRSLKKNGNVLQ